MTDLSRVVVLDDYQSVAAGFADWSELRSRGVDVSFVHEHLEGAELVSVLAGADAVVAMRERTALDAALLARLPGLRLIVTTGMANASIDLDAARERGIVVSGTPGSGTSTPEMAWLLMLAALRDLPREEQALRAGEWQQGVGRQAAGLAIGIVGLGRIGSRIARYASAFDMRVLAWSENLTPERAAECGAERVDDLLTLAERSDVLTIHLRLSERTRAIVGERELRALGPKGILVNTARAGIVDTSAMIRGLEDGWLGGAALDVHDDEPVRRGSAILRAPRTILSPHLGYVSDASYRAMYPAAVESIVAFLDGAAVRVLT